MTEFFNALIKYIEKFNTLIGFLSFLVSCVTLFFSIRIKRKIAEAEDKQLLKLNSKKIVGELQAFSIFIDNNEAEKMNSHSLKMFLIDLKEKYPFLKKKKRFRFILLISSLKKSDWDNVKRHISNLIAYIERI